MLTVRYDQLGLRAGDRLLDLGCGGGRHAFEALRRGAVVTALDLDDTELKDVAILFAAMTEAGEAGAGASGTLVNWALSDEYHNVPGGHIRIYRRGVLASRMADAGLEVTGWHHAHALHSPYWWLKCAVGTTNADHPLVKAYHRLLVWDIEKATPFTRVPDQLLNPVLGKSLIVYGRKP